MKQCVLAEDADKFGDEAGQFFRPDKAGSQAKEPEQVDADEEYRRPDIAFLARLVPENLLAKQSTHNAKAEIEAEQGGLADAPLPAFSKALVVCIGCEGK